MQLLTMSTLRCGRKDVKEGSLRLVATKVDVRESEFDGTFLEHVLPSIDWPSLRDAGAAVGITLPDTLEGPHRREDAFLRALHRLLFDVHVLEGQLICRESQQVFPIQDGRPNMMLPEDPV